MWAVDSYYSGFDGTTSSLDVEIDSVTYPVVPDSTNNKHLWMVNNRIFNQVGGLAGVVSVSSTYIFVSTTDGTYESPT